MKKTLTALFLTLSCFTASANALDELTINKLAANPETKAEFRKMTADHQLPEWVTDGGTDSQNQRVNIDGHPYLVLTSCKPHDCASQRMAVLYATETKKLAGVFSTAEAESEKLQWLNVSDALSVNGKTVLFAALTGSLDNHPGHFSFE